MVESETEAQFKQAFIERVKSSRKALGWKQWEMAQALGGMAQDKYKQYESRSLLPHHYIGLFCLITRVSPTWLMTGKGEKTIRPLEMAAGEPQRPAKPKKARSSKAA